MSNNKASQPKKFRSNGSVEKLQETKFRVIEIVIRCDEFIIAGMQILTFILNCCIHLYDTVPSTFNNAKIMFFLREEITD